MLINIFQKHIKCERLIQVFFKQWLVSVQSSLYNLKTNNISINKKTIHDKDEIVLLSILSIVLVSLYIFFHAPIMN